jgi:hypothetical protein
MNISHSSFSTREIFRSGILVSLLCVGLEARAQLPLQEIRTASGTELVAFFHSTNISGPVWATVYSTNEVNISQPSLWTLDGQPVTALNEFVTESDGVDYHIYLKIPPPTNGTTYTLARPYGSTNFVCCWWPCSVHHGFWVWRTGGTWFGESTPWFSSRRGASSRRHWSACWLTSSILSH